MKKILLFIVLIFSFFVINGQNLTFTRVINIDTILTVVGSSHPSSAIGTFVVPADRVWKIEYMNWYQNGSAGYFNSEKICLSSNSFPTPVADYNKRPIWIESGGYVVCNNSTISSSGWTSTTRFFISIIEFSTQ